MSAPDRLPGELGKLCVISEAEYDKMIKEKVYGIPTYVALKDGYAYVYPLPANVMDLERENERLQQERDFFKRAHTAKFHDLMNFKCPKCGWVGAGYSNKESK